MALDLIRPAGIENIEETGSNSLDGADGGEEDDLMLEMIKPPKDESNEEATTEDSIDSASGESKDGEEITYSMLEFPLDDEANVKKED